MQTTIALNTSQLITLKTVVDKELAHYERELAAATQTIDELPDGYQYRHEWTDSRDFILDQLANLKCIQEVLV